ncbi:hypothetical protein [Pseudomonas syringae]|uniref:Uncharacterized protein n=1 Tax=Pseudomonas syringae CC1417 TaxID=1357272 RepID=A0AAU8LF67_PSESX
MSECQQPQAHPARCGCEQAMSAAVLGAQNVNSAMSTIDSLRQQLADVSKVDGEALEKLKELVSAVRSINRSAKHEVRLIDDDEPCYAQRKEWVEWVLWICDEADEIAKLNGGES